MLHFGIFCGTSYVNLGLDGSKACLNVIQCKNNFYYCSVFLWPIFVRFRVKLKIKFKKTDYNAHMVTK
jgi:hypothetical protein